MAKYQIDEKKLSGNIKEIWVTENENPDTRRLAYKINSSTKNITFYPKEKDFFLSEIRLKGFENLPDDFSKKGYIKQGVQYHLDKTIKNKNIDTLIISKDLPSLLKKRSNAKSYLLRLNYKDFKELRKDFYNINQNSSTEKSNRMHEFFYRLFPTEFKENLTSSKTKYNSVIKNLSSDIIDHLTSEDLKNIESFVLDLLEKKYESEYHKFLQLARTKIEVDSVAIDRILNEFNDNLSRKISESKWGKFLIKNLFLLDSKYVKVFKELNLILGGQRKVDFGMIDTKGYLDIFEIKTPETPLLSNETDRGNYYWSTAAVKAIVQAEKYLYRAGRKASSLAEDLTEEKKVRVKVVKPRAFLIIGHSKQLDDEQRDNDFRILRSSLKNIEIILYDELLEGLENQKNKYYDQLINNDES